MPERSFAAPGPPAAVPGPATPATKAERFDRAMAAAPPERPRPLARWARRLARLITGRGPEPSVSTGRATDRVLHDAGSHAASQGTTVYLRRHSEHAPSPAEVGALAHEMVHVAARSGGHGRRPTAPAATSGPGGRRGRERPRFLFDDLLDDEERLARSVGDRARSAAAAVTEPVRSAVPSPVALAERVPGLPSAPAVPSLDSLPVAGPAAAVGAARDAATRAVSGASTAAEEGLAGVAGQVAELRSLVDRAMGGAETITAAGATAASRAVAAGEGVVSEASGRLDEARTAVSGLVGAAVGAASDPFSQMGALLEAFEERILAELERRGGRYAGVF